MLGKFRLVNPLGWDYSGKILAGQEKWGSCPFKSPISARPGQGNLQGQLVPHTLLLLPGAPILSKLPLSSQGGSWANGEPRNLSVSLINISSLPTLGMTLELSKATLDSRTKGKQNWKVKRWIQAHVSAKICTFTAKIWWDEKEKTIMCFSFAPWKLSVTAFRTWSKTHISEILYSMQRFQFLTLLKLKKKKTTPNLKYPVLRILQKKKKKNSSAY